MDYVGRKEYDEHNLRMEDEHKRLNTRLKTVEDALKQQNKLALAVEKLALNMEQMLKEQQKQGERIEELEQAPAKKWNTVVTAILSAIGGAIGTGVIAVLINYIK